MENPSIPSGSQLPSEIEEYAMQSGLTAAEWQSLADDKRLPMANRKAAVDLIILTKAGFTAEDLEAIGPFAIAVHTLDDKTPPAELPTMVLSLYSSYAERYGEMPPPSILDDGWKIARPAFMAQKEYGLLTDWLATVFEDTHGIELRASDE